MSRDLIPVQVAWAAGVIEGEGSIYAAVRNKRGHKDGKLIVLRIRVVMSDRDVVARLAAVFGVGKVHPYRNLKGLGTKPLFRWEVSARADVRMVADAIYLWMGERRRARLDELRALDAAYPLVSGQERARRTWATRHENRAAHAA